MKNLFKNSSFVQGFIFFIFAIFIIVNAVQMRGFGESFMSPGLFPALFGGVLLILSLNLFFRSFKEIMKNNSNDQISFENNKNINERSFFNVFIVLLLSLSYLWVLNKFGFIISTMIYLFVFMFYIGERRVSYLISVAVLTPLISYVIFTIILGVSLP